MIFFQNIQYQYYGAGLLSSYDRFPEHQKLIVGNKKKKERRLDAKVMKIKKEKGARQKASDDRVRNHCCINHILFFYFIYYQISLSHL